MYTFSDFFFFCGLGSETRLRCYEHISVVLLRILKLHIEVLRKLLMHVHAAGVVLQT